MPTTYLPRRIWLRVRELLAAQTALETIAEVTQLSPSTIAAIASGELQPSRIVVDDHDPNREEILKAQRCHGCGALVYVWPCLGCQMSLAVAEPEPVVRQVRGLGLKRKHKREQRRNKSAA
jgi:hypothetical protein